MQTTIEIGFTSHSMNPKQRHRPNEDIALSKYARALAAFRVYAEEQGLGEVTDTEGDNVYADMCMRRLSDLAKGWHHTLTLEGDEKPHLSARVEAFHYADYSTHGTVKIILVGPEGLIRRVQDATEDTTSLPPEEIRELGREFTRNKHRCYGYCRRRD